MFSFPIAIPRHSVTRTLSRRTCTPRPALTSVSVAQGSTMRTLVCSIGIFLVAVGLANGAKRTGQPRPGAGAPEVGPGSPGPELGQGRHRVLGSTRARHRSQDQEGRASARAHHRSRDQEDPRHHSQDQKGRPARARHHSQDQEGRAPARSLPSTRNWRQ